MSSFWRSDFGSLILHQALITLERKVHFTVNVPKQRGSKVCGDSRSLPPPNSQLVLSHLTPAIIPVIIWLYFSPVLAYRECLTIYYHQNGKTG